eukprot:6178308-Pleurochrysis_carterae.AAC.2
MLHGRAIARQQLNDRPLFILGHPRTGTTLLHTLLALDHEQFATCSTFCAGFPSGFLWLERFKGLFAGVVDSKRPMDNMELSFDTPQEDEIATNVLSAGRSPYMPLVFMTDEPSFRPFFSFRDACPEASSPLKRSSLPSATSTRKHARMHACTHERMHANTPTR